MKKHLTNAVSKKVFTLFIATFILCGLAPKSFALPEKINNEGAEIVYKGLQDNKLVFTVNYKNEALKPFRLVVRNEQNDILYSKEYDASPLNTKMVFTEVPENGKLTFFIVTGKKEVAQAFEINTNVKTVQEFIVKGI